jgi:hypothetical protein
MSTWIKDNIDSKIADYLFNVRVQLPHNVGVFQRDVRPDLSLDFEHLEEQMEEAPEMLAFWNVILAEQKAVVSTLKRTIIILRGRVTERILDDKAAQKVKLRRTDVEDLIETDDRIIDQEARLILEQKHYDRIEAVVESLKSRCEMLRSLAGFKKQERSETKH